MRLLLEEADHRPANLLQIVAWTLDKAARQDVRTGRNNRQRCTTAGCRNRGTAGRRRAAPSDGEHIARIHRADLAARGGHGG
ncbi:hypothetical protein [Acidisphaera sp. L21]|uniref:hypothetical protein n=1 Tax=Acidisphaera sp. L21 TaxID=1641851 RepID=UPI00131A8F29|nr:hypothetical protein [Acidisphaera sp. L21]